MVEQRDWEVILIYFLSDSSVGKDDVSGISMSSSELVHPEQFMNVNVSAKMRRGHLLTSP